MRALRCIQAERKTGHLHACPQPAQRTRCAHGVCIVCVRCVGPACLFAALDSCSAKPGGWPLALMKPARVKQGVAVQRQAPCSAVVIRLRDHQTAQRGAAVVPVRLIAGVHACRSRVHKLSASSCEVYAVRTFGSRTSSVHCCRLCTRDERPARLAHGHERSGAALSGRHDCTGRLRSAAAAATAEVFDAAAKSSNPQRPPSAVCLPT